MEFCVLHNEKPADCNEVMEVVVIERMVVHEELQSAVHILLKSAEKSVTSFGCLAIYFAKHSDGGIALEDYILRRISIVGYKNGLENRNKE